MPHSQPHIYLGADHRGYVLKESVQRWLEALGYEVTDCGGHAYVQDDDYPDVAAAVARAVAQNPQSRGVLLCGSSVGVTVAANKIDGARAAAALTTDEVRHGREADDINILTLAADHLDATAAQPLLTVFLTTPFSQADRAVRRLEKIEQLEHDTN